MNTLTENLLISEMKERYGLMIGGKDLYEALGFRRYAAFHRCKDKGELGVSVFSLPGRRGWFAFTNDVAAWLMAQANAAKDSEMKRQAVSASDTDR